MLGQDTLIESIEHSRIWNSANRMTTKDTKRCTRTLAARALVLATRHYLKTQTKTLLICSFRCDLFMIIGESMNRAGTFLSRVCATHGKLAAIS